MTRKVLPFIRPKDLLEEELWAKTGAMTRSAELSPLYVTRYAGPRIKPAYTAHNFVELLCVMRDSGELCTRDYGNIKLERGVVVLVPRRQDHYELSEGKLDTIWIGLTGTKADSLPSDRLMHTQSDVLPEVFEQLYFEARRRNANCGAILDSLTGLVLAKLLSKHSLEANGGIEQAMRYLQENFDQPVSFSQLAHDLGYSEGYFYRIFKKNCNVTPGEFLAQIRIEHAIGMIRRTGLPFVKIAEKCGIGDGLYLSRLVKKATGHSPKELRKLFAEHVEHEDEQA